jgi:hypothetical protein
VPEREQLAELNRCVVEGREGGGAEDSVVCVDDVEGGDGGVGDAKAQDTHGQINDLHAAMGDAKLDWVEVRLDGIAYLYDDGLAEQPADAFPHGDRDLCIPP